MNAIDHNINQYNAKRKLDGNVTNTCRCGKVFTRHRYRAGKYCSLKCRGDEKRESFYKINVELFKSGKLKHRDIIKRVMLSLGVEHKCQICGITEWQGKPLPMILDHINGRADNNMPDNLRLICSNCDSQTDHYKGKNKGNGRKSLGIL